MDELIFLGTGHAMTYHSYTTCLSLTDGQSHFITDGGGGNTVLLQMERAGLGYDDLTDVFLSHLHTDHILGAVWMARVAGHSFERGRTAPLTFYGHASVLAGFRTICEVLLPERLRQHFDEKLRFAALEDGETRLILGREVTFFDIGAAKTLQFGYAARLKNGETLVFLGDEPLRESGRRYAREATHLIHEALCLEAEAAVFNPHRISHSTVKDAAEAASALQTPHLILFHSDDTNLETRQRDYLIEAKAFFSGLVSAPYDLDRIPLDLEVLRQ